MYDFEHSIDEDQYIAFDEVCKKLSPAMMKAFKSAVVQRNRTKKQKNQAENILLHISKTEME